MKWILACHIIFVITWFAALFYLPRLFVYHADTKDELGNERFKIMEHKLYYYIMCPSAILTLIFGGTLLLHRYDYYEHQWWMHIKLFFVMLLAIYHLYCGRIVKTFKRNANLRSHKFYRYFNEVPSIILIVVIIMVVVQPVF